LTRALPGSLLAAALLLGAAPPPAGAAPVSAPAPLYQDLGPGIERIVLSDPDTDGARVLWTCGENFIAKIDAATFDIIATLRRPAAKSDDHGGHEAILAALDAGAPAPVASRPVAPGAASTLPCAGTLLDADGRLIVPEERRLVAYGDGELGVRFSGIRVAQHFDLPASIPGRFTGIARAADGHLVAATSAGWVVALARGFSRLAAARLLHAPSRESGTDSWVTGGPVMDDRGGVLIASARHLHRVAWDGANLSTAPEAGAWSEEIAGGCAPGAAPVVLRPGDEGNGAETLVAIATADRLSRVVLLRGKVAAQKEGRAPSPERPVGADPVAPFEAKQERAAPVDSASTTSLVAAGGDLLVLGAGGIVKLAWDEVGKSLRTAWTSAEHPASALVVSPDAKGIFFLTFAEGRAALVAIDGASGEVRLRRTLGGARFDPRGKEPLLDPAGRLVSGCLFGVLRTGIEP
jgi:hypothetical protein